MPGRVRLIHDAAEAEYGLALARRFAAHPAVESVRLAVVARSLTVNFNAAAMFADILEGLPAAGSQPAPITLIKSPRLRLGGLLSIAIDVMSGNTLGLGLALVRPLLGESTLIS